MLQMSLEQLGKLDWKPRHFVQKNGIQYGYEKAADPRFGIGVEGTIVDFVRIPAGHTIYEHYHHRARESFVVAKGTALFQTRMNDTDPRNEQRVKAGDVLHFTVQERHRVVNDSNDYLYLVRFTKKEESDSVDTELEPKNGVSFEQK